MIGAIVITIKSSKGVTREARVTVNLVSGVPLQAPPVRFNININRKRMNKFNNNTVAKNNLLDLNVPEKTRFYSTSGIQRVLVNSKGACLLLNRCLFYGISIR